MLAYLSGAEPASAAAASIIDGFVASGRNPAVVSAITVTEALVRPMRAASASAIRLVDDFLLHFPNLRVDPVTVGRRSRGGSDPGRHRGADPGRPDPRHRRRGIRGALITNDRSWTGVATRAGLAMQVVLLDARSIRAAADRG